MNLFQNTRVPQILGRFSKKTKLKARGQMADNKVRCRPAVEQFCFKNLMAYDASIQKTHDYSTLKTAPPT